MGRKPASGTRCRESEKRIMGNAENNTWRAAGNEWAPIIQPLGGCLPIFLVLCGILASVVLFCSGIYLAHCSAGSYYGGGDSAGWNGFAHFFDECVLCAGWCLVALSFFVGPLLFGIAGILRRLNQEKPDSRQETKSPSGGPTNPNLSSCPECGHYVSRLAKTCPKCGQPLTPERPSGAGGS